MLAAPSEILKMTGDNAARALRRLDVGVVEAGRRADLVLLAAYVRDIRNAGIVWVMKQGKSCRRGQPV